MKLTQWKTYRTRFLVKAKRLSSNLSFTDPLGRQHSGRKGDYLVESFEGVLSIAPKKIFEDVYVAMSDEMATRRSSTRKFAGGQPMLPLDLAIAAMLTKIPAQKVHAPINGDRQVDSTGISRARRKSPQPVRPSSSRMNFM